MTPNEHELMYAAVEKEYPAKWSEETGELLNPLVRVAFLEGWKAARSSESLPSVPEEREWKDAAFRRADLVLPKFGQAGAELYVDAWNDCYIWLQNQIRNACSSATTPMLESET